MYDLRYTDTRAAVLLRAAARFFCGRGTSQAKTETSLKYTGGGPTPTLYHTHAVRDTARRAESVLRLRDTQSAPYAPQTSLEISQRVC